MPTIGSSCNRNVSRRARPSPSSSVPAAVAPAWPLRSDFQQSINRVRIGRDQSTSPQTLGNNGRRILSFGVRCFQAGKSADGMRTGSDEQIRRWSVNFGFSRLKPRLRQFARRHPWVSFTIRSFVLFSAAFGGAYGFITGSRSENSGYDPHLFAIGASVLFALACVALAMLSMRLRWMRAKLRKVSLHNEALADRNWELKEAEERARSLFESQGDLIVLRKADGIISFVNDAYCDMAPQRRAPPLG